MSDNPPTEKSLKEQLELVSTSTHSDKNYNAAKALISSIPSIGSLVVNFMESYIASPAQRRLYAFLESLVKELEELKSKNSAVDFDSPVFVTTFWQAHQIAIRTHKEQKLEALRNAVLNSSIPSSLDDDLQSMFLNWIDVFTPTHIFILKCLHYLDQYEPEELKAQFPELEKNEALYNQILKNLVERDLIILREVFITEEENKNYWPSYVYPPIPQLGVVDRTKGKKLNTFRRIENINRIVNNSSSGMNKSKTTELGKQFIQFIESPLS